jgi:PAS domain S-box-containing protein
MCGYFSRIEERIGYEQTSAGDAEKMAHLLFQTSRDAIMLLDREWRIVAANEKCARFLGWDARKLRSRRFSRLFPAVEKDRLRDAMQRLGVEEKESWSGTMQLLTASGSESELAVEMHRLDLERRTLFQVLMRYPERQRRLAEEHHTWDSVGNWLVSLQGTPASGPEGMKTGVTAPQLLRSDVNAVPAAGAQGMPLLSGPEGAVAREQLGMVRSEPQYPRYDSEQETDRDLLKLTPTELEVCRYIHDGLSSKEIADVMKSSFETIQTHRKNIRRKMGLRGRKTALGTFLKVEKKLFHLDTVPNGFKADR